MVPILQLLTFTLSIMKEIGFGLFISRLNFVGKFYCQARCEPMGELLSALRKSDSQRYNTFHIQVQIFFLVKEVP